MLSDTSSRYLETLQDTNRHQQTPNNTNRRCQTPKKAVQGCVAVYVDINFRLLVSDDVLYCLMLSADVRRVSKKFLKGYLGAAYCLRLYCVPNALYWKSFKRQIFTHLTVLKHQNTKTSLYELSKNHWVFALFEIFGSVSKKLQSTVFNDHPVYSH